MEGRDVFSYLLSQRGLESEEEIYKFLNPSLKDLYDPFLLMGMKEAVDRILVAIKNNERIWIFGDYDVDGITSIAVLIKYFESVGFERFNYYIPDREQEGYGLGVQGIDAILDIGAEIIITVDCGINAFEAADYAKQRGVDLIITDHHSVEERLPNAYAVINPKRGRYPFEFLAGCGVAFKLVQALAGDSFPDIFPEIIDITAVGTVADVVPLIDENRVLVKMGLRMVKNKGLKTIIKNANKSPENLTSNDVAFSVAPTINSSGRIGNPSLAVELLVADDMAEINKMANSLRDLNIDRQEQGREIMEYALKNVEENIDYGSHRVLVVRGENWHTGIIGITASRLTDIYSRPVIILSDNDGSLKGSARSLTGISIYDIIERARDLLEKFGGHDQAAGMQMAPNMLEEFKEKIAVAAEDLVEDHMLIPGLNIDACLEPRMVSREFLDRLDKLAPYGMDNPEPLFCLHGLRLDQMRLVGANANHVKVTVSSGGQTLEGIAFNMAESFRGIGIGDEISLAFTLELNNFRGLEYVNLIIRDVISVKSRLKQQILIKSWKATANYMLSADVYGYYEPSEYDVSQALEQAETEYSEIYASSPEDLEIIWEKIYRSGFNNYRIVFGDQKTDESRTELIIRYAPITNRRALPLRTSEYFYLSHVPSREDLVRFFKAIRGKKIVDLKFTADRILESGVKLILCIKILEDLDIINARFVNGYVHIEWLAPEEKKNLEENRIFAWLNSKTGGRR